ncbi:carboxylesterase/lipase family protein [Mangrovibacterium lignilyticum]|uniref:carboxylesterase/lipase family protein n=1 Tax=Mangrovibacterium lignilyticum TaxID=2668052 RepID=UPI0013D0D60C|nr:carboxylesterase family protein [Mangrovibacterium lignilyticum]
MKPINRRSFLVTTLSAIPAVVLAGNGLMSFTSSVIETETIYGKVKGYDFNGVKIFRGIPYGDTTEGEARFLPPRKPQSWTGVKDCTLNGPRCIQGGRSIFETDRLGPYFSGGRADRFELSKQPSGEDCLNLNVLTPGITGKRPVMVYIHGGGFQDGGGLLAVFSDRHVREQDVVLVGINHRLNVFGYTYFGGIDKKYEVGNPGQLDLVAALEWVRDNIESFGGDPENVTIFGESGGGAKISTLLAMPAAKGLFHKAAIQSGSFVGKAMDVDTATNSARELMSKLGVTTVDDLQKVPANELFRSTMGGGMRQGPVVDGHSLPGDPWYPDSPEISANIPLLIGNDKDEATLFALNNESLFSLDRAGLRSELLKAKIPEDKVDDLLALYQKAHPSDSPSDLYFRISTDRGARYNAVKQAEMQLERGQADVFMYYFQYNTPVDEGRLRAFHTSDLPLIMRLTLYPESEQLSRQLSAAWAAFARNGNPGTKNLAWPAYATNDRATMIFDINKSEVVADPDKDIREMLLNMPSGSLL